MRINLSLSNIVSTTILLSGQLFVQADAQPLNQPLDYIAPIALSNNNLSTCNDNVSQDNDNDCFVFHGAFENIKWKGDLFAYKIDSNALISQQLIWSASSRYAAKEVTNPNYWETRRIVFGAAQPNKLFAWNNLTDEQKKTISGDTTTGEKIINFVRGKEVEGMRQREGLLGPIIHSNPVYIGAPDYTTATCQIGTAAANRTPHVYVGANDGMLHGFNAETGDETWAYIPSMLLGSLPNLVNSAYVPIYYVDGGLNARNVHFSSDNSCRTVLVGSLGAGGKGLFAVDVTDPGGTLGQQVLWELASDNGDMGYIFGYSSIIKLRNGKWYAATGNGFNSAKGNAVLYLLDIETGAVQKRVIASGIDISNGLSSPSFVDTNNDGMVDIAYAGDFQGDMWRFDLTDLSDIGSIEAHRIYDGSPDQPISTAPEITRYPGGYWVLFGTGRSYTAADINNNTTQAIYGIRDNLSNTTVTTANLLSRTLSDTINYTDENGDTIATVRTLVDATTVINNSQKGWGIALPTGEQLLTPPKLRDGRLRTTITQTDKEDSRLNENWIMEVTYDQGSSAGDTFDLDDDGYFNFKDRVDGNNDDDTHDREDKPVAWKRNNGLLSEVTIARVSSNVDAFFWNILAPWQSTAPPLPEVGCIGDCENGLEEGHIDVDTDHILGDFTYAHIHNYDDEVRRINSETGLREGAIGRTYVDYFNINEELEDSAIKGAGTSCSGLQNIDGNLFTTDSTKYTGGETSTCPEKLRPAYEPSTTYYPYARIIPDDKPFIILIANADLSPGAEIIMGKNSAGEPIKYNVAKYQKMMHQVLAEWNGSADLIDPDGNSLVHTINSLKANEGTLRIQFDSRVIVNGGVIPTNASCVVPNYIRNDRWRNAALTMHIVERDHFLNNTNALNRVKIQQPSDLVDTLYIKGEIVNLSEAGGLRANDSENSNGFLYESTIFWHYSGVACYGDPDYDTDVRDTLFRLLLEKNGVDRRYISRVSVDDGCDAIADRLSLDTPEKRKAFIETCEKLVDEVSRNYYTGSGFSDSNGDSGTGGDGSAANPNGPSISDGASASGGAGTPGGLGPNSGSQPGRAYWIDIVP